MAISRSVVVALRAFVHPARVSSRDIKIQNEIWTVWMAIATGLPAAVAELCFVDGRVDGGQSSVFG